MRNRKIIPIALTAILSLHFSSCERLTIPSVNEESIAKEANSLLQIRTRAAEVDEEGTVSYPVNVYVFQEEECVAVQVIENESQSLSILLPRGIYSVYAVGGATDENYILPSKEDATPSMKIALREGQKHGDLMVAKSTVNLKDDETNIVTLSMERRVMMLQGIILENIPSYATSVSVTITPLYTSLEGMEYKGGPGSETVSLTQEDEDGTWIFDNPIYLLPPSEKSASITVSIGKAEGVTTSYTYNTSEQLESGYKITIRGKYTGHDDFRLTGTITGAAWEEKTISFNFNENGSSTEDSDNSKDDNTEGGDNDDNDNDEGDDENSTIPQVGETYMNCFVLSVDKDESTVLLLSPKYKEIKFSEKIDSKASNKVKERVETELPSCGVEGIDGWRLMTDDEAQTFFNLRKQIPSYKDIPSNKITDYRYFAIDQNNYVLYFGINLSFSNSKGYSFTTDKTFVLQPVTTIKIK